MAILHTLDGLFCASLGYAIGRLGCFLAGDGDYGPPTPLPWGLSFPHGLVPTMDRVHPTMLYTALWELSLFVFFWWLSSPRRTFTLRPGTLLCGYLLCSSLGRFATEFLSRNPKLALGFTEAQWVSAFQFLLGSGLLAYLSVNADTVEAGRAFRKTRELPGVA